jgi:hypothetical protein
MCFLTVENGLQDDLVREVEREDIRLRSSLQFDPHCHTHGKTCNFKNGEHHRIQPKNQSFVSECFLTSRIRICHYLYGSGFFHHQAKIIRKNLISTSLKNDVKYLQRIISKKPILSHGSATLQKPMKLENNIF